jgi:hypothetical protein
VCGVDQAFRMEEYISNSGEMVGGGGTSAASLSGISAAASSGTSAAASSDTKTAASTGQLAAIKGHDGQTKTCHKRH